MFTSIKQPRRSRTGQNITEYAILVTIILGAFIATSTYVKRGIQGRWKEAVDELGDQYDPTAAQTTIIYRTNSATNTFITARPVGDFINSSRNDITNTVETKTGDITVDAY